MCFLFSICFKLIDIRRLTDWSVASALSNNDIEALSLKETDIHDVTAVRMAAKLTENVRLDLTYTSEILLFHYFKLKVSVLNFEFMFSSNEISCIAYA